MSRFEQFQKSKDEIKIAHARQAYNDAAIPIYQELEEISIRKHHLMHKLESIEKDICDKFGLKDILEISE